MSNNRDIIESIPAHIRAMKGYVPGKTIEEVVQAYHPPRISKLASNENRWGHSSRVYDAVQQAMNVANNYPSALANGLRDDLAAHLKCEANQLVIGSGSESLLGLLCRTFFEEGDEIITASATFVGLNIQAHIQNIPVKQIPLTSGYAFDVGAIAASVTEQTKMVYIANPNNPTGTMISQQELDVLMASLPSRVLLVLDEAYIEFAEHLPNYPSTTEMIRRVEESLHPNTLILRTFSKAYGLASFRVGYAIGHPELISALWKTKNTFEPSGISEAAARAALADQEFLAYTVVKSNQARSRFESFLTEKNIPYVPSAANFVMILARDQIDALRITEELLHQGVIVRQLSPFGIPNGVRITVGIEEEMEHLESALAACWNSQN